MSGEGDGEGRLPGERHTDQGCPHTHTPTHTDLGLSVRTLRGWCPPRLVPVFSGEQARGPPACPSGSPGPPVSSGAEGDCQLRMPAS